jgi:hypothetical protein
LNYREALRGILESIVENELSGDEEEREWVSLLREEIYGYAENLDDPDGLKKGYYSTLANEHRKKIAHFDLREIFQMMGVAATPPPERLIAERAVDYDSLYAVMQKILYEGDYDYESVTGQLVDYLEKGTEPEY